MLIAAYVWFPWKMDGARLRAMAPKDETAALATDRDAVLKILAGIGGGVAVVYTVRRHTIDRRTLEATRQRDSESARLTTEAQATDRYVKAIGLLASDKPEERLGGIYALERLMADSPRDQHTILEVLAAFARRTSPVPNQGQALPAEDLSAAITVLTRRPRSSESHTIDLRRTHLAGLEIPIRSKADRSRGIARPDLARADLRGSDLTGADLGEIDLSEADLHQAQLTGVRFRFADLSGAYMDQVVLANAVLSRINLQGARLADADLTGVDSYRSNFARVDLTGANLTGARLVRVNLTDVSFRRADLTGVDLTDSNLTNAVMDGAVLTGVTLAQYSFTVRGATDEPLPGIHLDGTDLTSAHVTAAQLAGAYLTDSTKLPDALAADPWVRARIAECQAWAAGLKARGRSLPGDLDGLLPTPDPNSVATAP